MRCFFVYLFDGIRMRVMWLDAIHHSDWTSYFFAPMELKSLSFATCAIKPWINSIDARLQSRVAFVSLSSVRFSLGSPPDEDKTKAIMIKN